MHCLGWSPFSLFFTATGIKTIWREIEGRFSFISQIFNCSSVLQVWTLKMSCQLHFSLTTFRLNLWSFFNADNGAQFISGMEDSSGCQEDFDHDNDNYRNGINLTKSQIQVESISAQVQKMLSSLSQVTITWVRVISAQAILQTKLEWKRPNYCNWIMYIVNSSHM